ncbi:hypothetical protein IFR05_010891 [Cadophora sp. M221]|nr:hypothetical protein IFR05_010891 [Cadophora sp. M221]
MQDISIANINNIKTRYLRPIVFLDDTDLRVPGVECKTIVAILGIVYGQSVTPGNQHHGAAQQQTASPSKPKTPANSSPRDYPRTQPPETATQIEYFSTQVATSPMAQSSISSLSKDKYINAIVRKYGYTIIERNIIPEDLRAFSEAFVSGSAAELAVITKIDNVKFEEGPVYRELLEAYHDLIRRPEE